MTAEIISIGTELLLGHIINTNTAFLSQKLAEAGIDVYYTSVVGDNPGRITSSIRQAIGRSDIVITTGGLGPTVDDVTIETVAALIGKKLVLNKMVLKCLRDYFKFKKIKIPEATLRQAYTPEGVKCVRNKAGTAPGLLINWKDKVIICLPGPPRELEPMVVDDIIPYLMGRQRYVRRAHFSAPYRGPSTLRTRTIKITGLAESMVNKAVKDLLELKPPATVGIYAKLDEVDLRIMAKAGDEKSAAKAIGKIEAKIRSRLKDYIFGYDDETLEGSVGAVLTARKKTIAVAESCTGGLLANRLTNVSGSSRYFMAGITAYSNAIKENILGVSAGSLGRYGAVSRQVALEMAENVRRLCHADIGVGITGIAGPGGGTRAKPVGLVYIALAANRIKIVRELRFKGSREEIKFRASQAALDLLRKNT